MNPKPSPAWATGTGGTHRAGRIGRRSCAPRTPSISRRLAFRALKAANSRLQVGSAFDVAPMFPATSAYEDLAAAERWHRFQNLWFITPALHGHYPEGVLPPEHQATLLGFREGDERIMRAPLDFMGLNYYSPWVVKFSTATDSARDVNTSGQWATAPVHTPKTDIGWDIFPQGVLRNPGAHAA